MLVAAVELETDPIGLLEIGAPSDEYAPEIGTIVPRLVSGERLDDVVAVLHEEFMKGRAARNTVGIPPPSPIGAA